MKKRKQRKKNYSNPLAIFLLGKKKPKKDELLTGIFWLDVLIIGGVIVGILNYKSFFGTE
jgi:hypothetical protein